MVIPFFTDHNVPDSLGNALLAHGHSVVRLRDCIPRDANDVTVAITCALSERILVSFDRDFKQVAKRLALSRAEYRTRLHRIDMRCFEPDGASRIVTVLSLIEHEWAIALQTADARMVIEIGNNAIRIIR